MSNYDLAALALPACALAAYFIIPKFSRQAVLISAGGVIDYIYRCANPDLTDIAGASWFPRSTDGWQHGSAWDWHSKEMVTVLRKPASLKSSILKSQSGKGTPQKVRYAHDVQTFDRYDRSRYANNGRPDNSYTAQKTERPQYKKMYFKDGSVRMKQTNLEQHGFAATPKERSSPPKSTKPTFSGLSMDPDSVTRDLTTEKDAVQRSSDKKDLESTSHSPIAMQDDGGDASGDVGW